MFNRCVHILMCLLCFPPLDMFADATAARGGSSQRGAEDGVAVKGSGAGSCRAQIPLCQRSAVLLRTDGWRQRRLCPSARVTHRCAKIETEFHQSFLLYETSLKRTNGKGYQVREVSTGRTIFFRKGVKFGNLLLIPFREEGNFLLEEKKIHNLHFDPEKFLRFSLIGVLEAETALRLWHRDTPTQCSVMVRWGDRDLFSVWFLTPWFNTHRHWEDESEKSSPSCPVPVQGDLRRRRRSFPGLSVVKEIQTEVSADQEGVQGAPALHVGSSMAP